MSDLIPPITKYITTNYITENLCDLNDIFTSSSLLVPQPQLPFSTGFDISINNTIYDLSQIFDCSNTIFTNNPAFLTGFDTFLKNTIYDLSQIFNYDGIPTNGGTLQFTPNTTTGVGDFSYNYPSSYYNNITFIVTASSFANNSINNSYPSYAFNHYTSGNKIWECNYIPQTTTGYDDGPYNPSRGIISPYKQSQTFPLVLYTTLYDDTSMNGEWLQITYLKRFILSSYEIAGSLTNDVYYGSRCPCTFVILGTNADVIDNDIVWDLVDSQSFTNYNVYNDNSGYLILSTNNISPYYSYRIVVNTIGNNLNRGDVVDIYQWNLFGKYA
jgi:hypothetical protein